MKKNLGRRLKVLMSAYACEPGKGSEPGVGWNMAVAMAARHDVWVLTRANNRAAIEAELALRPVSGLKFVYYDLPRAVLWLKRGQAGVHFYYYVWQWAVYRLARKLHRAVGFDVVHHATFGKYWAPSLLCLLPAPFLWGPVGGGETPPASMVRRACGTRGMAYEAARAVGRWFGERDPFVKLAARRSMLTVATTRETRRRLCRLGARRVVVYPQAGLAKDDVRHLEGASAGDAPIRFISIGRLLDWKGFKLGLRAFAQADVLAEYWIVGDGPERRRLDLLAKALGISKRVRLLGPVPRSEVLERLRMSHVLIHPSLHDSSPSVCLEAMAAGLPIVCLDVGGPGVLVDEEAGIKVSIGKPERVLAELASAIRRLADDPGLRIRMGAAGRRRVARYFMWEQKAEQFAQFYGALAAR